MFTEQSFQPRIFCHVKWKTPPKVIVKNLLMSHQFCLFFSPIFLFCRHQQHSMIIVPMDRPRVKKIRPLMVFGNPGISFWFHRISFFNFILWYISAIVLRGIQHLYIDLVPFHHTDHQHGYFGDLLIRKMQMSLHYAPVMIVTTKCNVSKYLLLSFKGQYMVLWLLTVTPPPPQTMILTK